MFGILAVLKILIIRDHFHKLYVHLASWHVLCNKMI